MCFVIGHCPIQIGSFLLQPIYGSLLDISRWSKIIHLIISGIRLIASVGRYDVEHDETKCDHHKRHDIQACELWRKKKKKICVIKQPLKAKTASLKDLKHKMVSTEISRISANTQNVNTHGQLFQDEDWDENNGNVLIFFFCFSGTFIDFQKMCSFYLPCSEKGKCHRRGWRGQQSAVRGLPQWHWSSSLRQAWNCTAHTCTEYTQQRAGLQNTNI